MAKTLYDDGAGTRIHLHDDGTLEIERCNINGLPVVLTRQEAMEVATEIISMNLESRETGEEDG